MSAIPPPDNIYCSSEGIDPSPPYTEWWDQSLHAMQWEWGPCSIMTELWDLIIIADIILQILQDNQDSTLEKIFTMQ